jgi:hypothetical protein
MVFFVAVHLNCVINSLSISGLRLMKVVSKQNMHKYFPVQIHQKRYFINKATATWFLQSNKTYFQSIEINVYSKRFINFKLEMKLELKLYTVLY